MVGNACFLQPRDYGGDVVIEAMYSISIISGITLRLLDIVFLCSGEVVLLGCLRPISPSRRLLCYREIFLLCCHLEQPLTCVVLRPYPVA